MTTAVKHLDNITRTSTAIFASSLLRIINKSYIMTKDRRRPIDQKNGFRSKKPATTVPSTGRKLGLILWHIRNMQIVEVAMELQSQSVFQQ